MGTKVDLYKIESNHVVPARGKVLISEPFLCDQMFGRSVVLLVDHNDEGSMGLVLNKPLPLQLNHLLEDFRQLENIPIYQGGPLCTDTLFYLHTIREIKGSLPISDGFYLNGDFNAVKSYILQGHPLKGRIRFFLGYSGWEHLQLWREIKNNTWMVGDEDLASLMDEEASYQLWKNSLSRLGGKYELWSRFPQVPGMN